MYDKTVRRRRAVLGLLIACSLILLTAYFGESSNGSLHAIQRGVLGVVSPIEDVASRAVSPVRNLFSWIGDTFDAKGQVKDLRKQANVLRRENIALNAQNRALRQLNGIKQVDTNSDLAANDPVGARVISASPNVWYKTIVIDKGTDDGIREGMPVLGADDSNGGLIGKVTLAAGSAARVSLITDDTSFVSAQDVETGVRSGVMPQTGNPGNLVWAFPQRTDPFKVGDTIVTSGTCSVRNDSLFPQNIPIGTITNIDDPGTSGQTIHIRPLVNLRRVENVQVLTRTIDGNRGPSCPL